MKMCSISVEPMPSTISTPKWRLEPLADLRGQRLAGRGDESQRDVLAARQPGRGQHAGEAGRRAVEHRGLHAADAAGEPLERGVGRGPLGHQQHGGADAHRERERIAEAVGEEELGRGEAHVALGEAEDGLAVELAGPVGIGVRVHRALRSTGRTRRVQPERRDRPPAPRRAWASARAPR